MKSPKSIIYAERAEVMICMIFMSPTNPASKNVFISNDFRNTNYPNSKSYYFSQDHTHKSFHVEILGSTATRYAYVENINFASYRINANYSDGFIWQIRFY